MPFQHARSGSVVLNRLPRCARIALTLLLLLPCFRVDAGIRFEEVTARAGIEHRGTSWGASWGDFNGDGWPDLWVGNHNTRPVLYLNDRRGGFRDIVPEVWTGDPRADTHGAAWADFDSDGDADLVELVDALAKPDGSLVPGQGRNHLFVNTDGRLRDEADERGLAQPGHGLTPLWLDADGDGDLDLLAVNARDKQWGGSVLYLQDEGRFARAPDALGFRDGRPDRWERAWKLWDNLVHWRWRKGLRWRAPRFLVSAQLADLTGDHRPELVLLSDPARVFALKDGRLEDISHTFDAPAVDEISDAAFGDFDGDGRTDVYLTRGEYLPPDMVREGEHRIMGTLKGTSSRRPPHAVRFACEGDAIFAIYPEWMPLSRIRIGSSGSPRTRRFRLRPEEAIWRDGPAPEGKVTIRWLAAERVWELRNGIRHQPVDYIVDCEGALTRAEPVGFAPFRPRGRDVLLLGTAEGFRPAPLEGAAGEDTACHYVVAGDFDNDMDEDLYMVCTGPVHNLPNRLLENDGAGRFTLVKEAGGAAGSMAGRGDTVVVADYDRDGFLDLFVTNGADPTSPFVADGPHQLFHNLGNGNHWIEIDLEGRPPNRDAIGAVVEVTAGGRRQFRVQGGGMHRMSQSHARIHFGLGPNATVQLLRVRWPDGATTVLKDVPGNQVLSIREHR